MDNASQRVDVGVPRIKRDETAQSTLVIATFGCVGFVLLIATIVGGCGAFLYLGGRAVEPLADDFFDRYNKQEYAEIYEQASSFLKKETRKDQIVTLLKNAHDVLGNCTAHTRRGAFVASTLGSRTTVATYECEFTNGTAIVKLTFLKTESSVRLIGFDFSSPLFVTAMTCSKCGAKLKDLGAFCSFCGAPLTGSSH